MAAPQRGDFFTYSGANGAPPQNAPRSDERTHLKWFQVQAQFEVFAENVHEAQHIFMNNHGAAVLTAATFKEKA